MYNETDRETDGRGLRRLLVPAVVALLVVGGAAGAYVALQEDEEYELPAKVNAPEWNIGQDWWYEVENIEIDHQDKTNTTEKGDLIQTYVSGIGYQGGTAVFKVYSAQMKILTTRRDFRYETTLSREHLNSIDYNGKESDVTFRFPLFNQKEWQWEESGETVHNYKISIVRDVETPAGSFDTFKVRETYEHEGWLDYKFQGSYYYSPQVENVVKTIYRLDAFDDEGKPVYTDISIQTLLLVGQKDGDEDGMSDKGEAFFGTDPRARDTDGDGYSDLEDVVPLYDYGIAVNLTHFHTDEDVEDTDEVLLYGENEGADATFEITSYATDETLTTEPVEDSDDTDLDIQLIADIPDDAVWASFMIYCYDTDENGGDDDFDITGQENEYYLYLEVNIFGQYLEEDMGSGPGRRLTLNEEQESVGNGDADYDAALRYIVSELDMANYD